MPSVVHLGRWTDELHFGAYNWIRTLLDRMRNFLSSLIPGYKNYWRKAFDFKGKTTRIEYWATELVATFAYFIVSFLALDYKAS